MKFHPGGKQELMRCAGGDGTAIYNEIHPWVGINMIEMLQVGVLNAGVLDFTKPIDNKIALSRDEWRSFSLVHTEQISDGVVLLRFSIGDGRLSGLRCGQHVDIRLRSQVAFERQYTPVSDIAVTGILEFVVKVYPSGKLGPALAQLKVGQSVEMRRTGGHISYLGTSRFGLGVPDSQGYSEVDVAHVLMLGAGSGITPMIQILKSMEIEWKNGAALKVTLVSCNRREEDIIYRDHFEKMALEFEGLRLRLILSRPPQASATWTLSNSRKIGDVLHIAGHINEQVLHEALGSTQASDSLVLCCGPEDFNEAAGKIFARMNVPNMRVHIF